MALEVGKIVSGKVSGITSFGAFVELEGGKTGLVHISEVAKDYVKDINSHISQNQEVKVKILSIDQNGKISLSIKQALEEGPKSTRPIEFDWSQPKYENMSFEDKMLKFKQDSDEKMQSFRRYYEQNRRSGYRKFGGSY
mgnify:FL=1